MGNTGNEKTGGKSDYQKITNRVSKISIVGNTLLSVGKFVAGILGHSEAMVSDAVHSTSDIAGSLIVMVGTGLSEKDADKEHPYGHERLECVTSILLSILLLGAAIAIGSSAFNLIRSGEYLTSETPGLIALIAAIVSIVSKESMFWYTLINAKKIGSTALKAEAWHHRSDALSSVGSLIGIAGARMGFPILDPVAGLVICLFILKAAYDIFKEAIDKMIDKSCDEKTEEEIRSLVIKEQGVKSVDFLRTREFGRKMYIDLEIGVDGSLSLTEAHEIAENVHDALETYFPLVKHVMVHVNPA